MNKEFSLRGAGGDMAISNLSLRLSRLLAKPQGDVLILLLLFIFLLPLSVHAEQGQLVKDITATGSCAVVGMTSDQARLTALQNARMSAIEQAYGVRISSSSVVTDGRLAVDFIRAYSSGYIVNEKYRWHDLKQIKLDGNSAPIPEYGVTITADVYIPKKKQNLGLKAEINTVLFKQGEKAKLGIRTAKDVKLAVFNIRADDKVAMLLPNPYMKEDSLKAGRKFIFPGDNAAFELAMGTLEGHKTDSEAFLIAVLPVDYKMPFEYLFKFNELMGFADFYQAYSKIADDVEDSLIAYTVVGKQ